MIILVYTVHGTDVEYRYIVIIVIAFLFTQLPWPGSSEGTFRSSIQAATCHLSTTEVEASHCPFFFVELQAEKLRILIFIVLTLI